MTTGWGAESNQGRLEAMLAIPNWRDISLLEEAVRLATPIFVPWLEKRVNEDLSFGTILTMFSQYDPLKPEDQAHVGKSNGPLHYRVVEAHRTKKDRLPNFNDWVIQCLDDQTLIDRIQALPQTIDDFYVYSIKRQLPKTLDFYYQKLTSEPQFVSLKTLLMYYDPKTNVIYNKRKAPLRFMIEWHKRRKVDFPNLTLKNALLSIVEGKDVRKQIEDFPETYDGYVKLVMNRNIDTILKRFAEVKKLYQEVHGWDPTPSHLMKSVNLRTEYSKDNIPKKPYNGTLHRLFVQVHNHRRLNDPNYSIAQTYEWFLGCVDDEKKREQLRQIFIARGKTKGYRVKSTQTLEERFHKRVAEYVPMCERLGLEEKYISFFDFLRQKDPALSIEDGFRKKPIKPDSPVYSWLIRQKQGQETPTETAVRLIQDPDLKKRFQLLPYSLNDFIQRERVKKLTQTIPLYIETALTSIETYHQPLTLQAFLRDVIQYSDGTFVRKMSNGDYLSIYSSFPRTKGISIDQLMISQLPTECRAEVKKVPQTIQDMYTYLINKYAVKYVQWAPQALQDQNHIFRLWKFFSDMDPDLPYAESDQGSRKGPLFKMITYFNQHQKAHGFDDFDEWAMSQIKDPVVLEWVRAVPKNPGQKWSLVLSQYVDNYKEHASYHIFSKLHRHIGGKLIPRLIPQKFIGQTDFSRELEDDNLYTVNQQGGTCGTALRLFYSMNNERISKQQSPITFHDWVYSLIWPEKRERFLTTAQHMTSNDPEIQEQAYKIYYPKYLDLCAHHQLPRSQILAPNDFVQKVFPDLYARGKQNA